MTRISRTSRVLATVAAAALVLAPTATAALCSRASLSEITRRYIAAQSIGEPRYLGGLSRTTAYAENHEHKNVSQGLLSRPLKIDHSRSIHDTAECAAYTELIVTDPANPLVIGTQIRLDRTNSSSSHHNDSSSSSYHNRTSHAHHIASIESVVAGPDDWLFNAQHTLHYALLERWTTIPAARRDNRTTIRAAADAYLDLFRKGNGSVPVPWADHCKRLEGGLYTAPGDTCNSGVPSGVDLVDRRYVIDETIGSVDVFLSFGGGNNSTSGLPDSHQFRVENGQIRFVHTITRCFEKNCGMKAPDMLEQSVGY